MRARDESGFSLIEVVVSMAIVTIGFVGVYGLVSLSDQALQETVDREQMGIRAGQILEEIGNELFVNNNTPLTNFTNVDLMQSDCTALVDPNSDIRARKRRWCERLNDTLGVGLSSDAREITVSPFPGEPDSRLVKVTLSTKGGRSRVSVARKFNVSPP